MAEGSEDDTDKSFEPTQKKLDDARRKGEIARSTDLNATAMYFGFILIAFSAGAGALLQLGETLAAFYSRADALSDVMFDGRGTTVLAPAAKSLLLSLAPFALIPAITVILSITAQRGFVFAPEKLKMKANRISLISNFKNKFGSRGIFEFVKSTVKLFIYAVVCFYFLQSRFDDILLAMHQSAEIVAVLMLELSIQFLLIVFVISAIIGGIDYFWQRFEHLKKHRMSHKELRDEQKEAEGDPYLKQARRGKAEQIALNSMLQEVAEADVVVVNPTHYAVALKWARLPGTAPECCAKGVDEIALRIRAIAEENNVPIHSDPPTARALHATMEIGDEIHPNHYQAVAAAIRFSDAMRAKAKARFI